jgi:hypothetical protein
MKFKVNEADGWEGVTFKFLNGASLSVQSSPSHMCTVGESVEVHAWGPNRERISLHQRRDVVGWVRVDDLPAIMRKVKAWIPK